MRPVVDETAPRMRPALSSMSEGRTVGASRAASVGAIETRRCLGERSRPSEHRIPPTVTPGLDRIATKAQDTGQIMARRPDSALRPVS